VSKANKDLLLSSGALATLVRYSRLRPGPACSHSGANPPKPAVCAQGHLLCPHSSWGSPLPRARRPVSPSLCHAGPHPHPHPALRHRPAPPRGLSLQLPERIPVSVSSTVNGINETLQAVRLSTGDHRCRRAKPCCPTSVARHLTDF
jgi:hypothetical protein